MATDHLHGLLFVYPAYPARVARSNSGALCLLFAIGERWCALPVTYAMETMRPQPIEPLPSAPAYLLGLAMIRGEPTAVVDLNVLLGASTKNRHTRFITLRDQARPIALAVESIVGVRELPASFAELSPLVRDALPELVRAIGTLDSRLLLVLENTRIVPESVWRELEAQ